MSDKTFGVKVSEELYDRVKSMIENSGGSSKEWFEKAVAISEMQSIKQGASDYSQDLNELEVHTSRIYELISNMVQRSIYIKDHAVQEIADKLEQREAIIGEYQEKTKTAIEELKFTQESLKALEQEKAELSKQLESQQATLGNNQALIQEYKEKIDTLSSLVNQYKGYASENVELKETFAAEKERMTAEQVEKESRLASSIKEYKSTVQDQQTQIEQLTRQLDSTFIGHEKEMESLKDNHVNELTRLTNEKNLERERAILEVERKYQEKLQKVHDQYNEKLARLYEKFERNENVDKKSGEEK